MRKNPTPFIPVTNPASANKIERENIAEKAKTRDKNRRPENKSKISRGSRRRAG